MTTISEPTAAASNVKPGYYPQTLAIASAVRDLYGGTLEFGVTVDNWKRLLDTIEAYFGAALDQVYAMGFNAGYATGQRSVFDASDTEADPYYGMDVPDVSDEVISSKQV